MRTPTESNPPFSPLAEINPLIALSSALPNPNGGRYLGGLNWVHHFLLVLGTVPIWEAFAIVSAIISGVLVGLATFFARSRVRWLTRGTS